MSETALTPVDPAFDLGALSAGTGSIVKFSEIFLLASRGARTRVHGAGWLDERDYCQAC